MGRKKSKKPKVVYVACENVKVDQVIKVKDVELKVTDIVKLKAKRGGFKCTSTSPQNHSLFSFESLSLLSTFVFFFIMIIIIVVITSRYVHHYHHHHLIIVLLSVRSLVTLS